MENLIHFIDPFNNLTENLNHFRQNSINSNVQESLQCRHLLRISIGFNETLVCWSVLNNIQSVPRLVQPVLWLNHFRKKLSQPIPRLHTRGRKRAYCQAAKCSKLPSFQDIVYSWWKVACVCVFPLSNGCHMYCTGAQYHLCVLQGHRLPNFS